MPGPDRVKVLALVGSLRQASCNRAFCEAAAVLCPPGLSLQVFEGLGGLPLFNPDLESDPPEAVVHLRERIAAADCLLIASPEYAHGIASPLKNALDWLVSVEDFVGKRVAVVNTAPRAHHAHDATLEILRTMSAQIVETTSSAIPVMGRFKSAEEVLVDCEASRQVAVLMGRLLECLASGCGTECDRERI